MNLKVLQDQNISYFPGNGSITNNCKVKKVILQFTKTQDLEILSFRFVGPLLTGIHIQPKSEQEKDQITTHTQTKIHTEIHIIFLPFIISYFKEDLGPFYIERA